jgi:hypothetical protein
LNISNLCNTGIGIHPQWNTPSPIPMIGKIGWRRDTLTNSVAITSIQADRSRT